MAICKDNKRKTYYITYKFKLKDGTYKTVNIRNKDWTFKKGKEFVENIEADIIEKDRKEREEKIVNESKITLSKLIDEFSRVKVAEGIDDLTIYAYNSAYKNYLFPLVKQSDLVENVFTTSLCDKYKIKLFENKLDPRTMNNKIVALKKLIDFAIKRKYINRDNGLDCLDILTRVKEIKKINDNNFFKNDDEDLRKFENSFKDIDNEWYLPIFTLFYSATRMGEFVAIQVKDCDFENNTIKISKQVDVLGNFKDRTKAKNEKLAIIPSQFMTRLKEYVISNKLSDNDFLFGNHKTPISRQVITNMIYKHLKIAGLPHITPHGLRHSFATRMFDKGYNVKQVQAQLGHTSMQTTMQYYIHYSETNKKKNLDDLL